MCFGFSLRIWACGKWLHAGFLINWRRNRKKNEFASPDCYCDDRGGRPDFWKGLSQSTRHGFDPTSLNWKDSLLSGVVQAHLALSSFARKLRRWSWCLLQFTTAVLVLCKLPLFLHSLSSNPSLVLLSNVVVQRTCRDVEFPGCLTHGRFVRCNCSSSLVYFASLLAT